MRFLLSFVFVFFVTFQVQAQVSTADSSVKTQSVGEVTETKKTNVDTRTESEIPLNLDQNKKAETEGSGFFRILFTLSILGLLGAGAFFVLRKYSIPKGMKHQTQIKVLQQHYLGPKKSLAIVRVAGESILIGVTDHNITMIKSLSLLDDEVPEEAPQSFGRVLKGQNSQNELADSDNDEIAPPSRTKFKKDLDPDEEFAISGIKDIVSKRLKGMRSLQ